MFVKAPPPQLREYNLRKRVKGEDEEGKARGKGEE
jgi:hypothetical protein